MSLVRVTDWINRFLANITKPQSDRESGELNPRELKQAEEQTIKRAQQECFPDEIRALEDDKPLPSKRTSLKITSCMGDFFNLTHDCDIQKSCQKRRTFQ